jgi:hypothetical protein
MTEQNSSTISSSELKKNSWLKNWIESSEEQILKYQQILVSLSTWVFSKGQNPISQ